MKLMLTFIMYGSREPGVIHSNIFTGSRSTLLLQDANADLSISTF